MSITRYQGVLSINFKNIDKTINREGVPAHISFLKKKFAVPIIKDTEFLL